MPEKKIGFIGQGFIGKNYADDFEKRGYQVVRYALEEPYNKNKEKLKDCDIVFIAVPTPSVNGVFSDEILRAVVKMVPKGSIAVIKSTLLPGRTESIQAENPEIYLMHSPEFLREASAAHDAANPDRNIIGLPTMTDDYKKKAQELMDVLPEAPFKQVCSSREAELIKYAGNEFLYIKVIFANMLHDLCEKTGARYEEVRKGMINDPRIGTSHTNPIHDSGRGAGGHCFIKDSAAFLQIYKEMLEDELGLRVLESLRDKNIDLLVKSGKDLELLEGVHGDILATKN